MVFPVRTNLRAQNAFRAPGVVEGVTVLEQAIDELAARLDLDPLELRRLNHVDVDQGSGYPYSSKQLLACYDRAAELAGWAERDALREPQRRRAAARDGLRDADLVGRRRAAGARDRSASTPTATRSSTTGIQDIGTGTLTSARIVAAEELGLPLDRVASRGGDTAPNLYGPVAGGSMTTPVGDARGAERGRARCGGSCSGSPPTCFEIGADDLVVSRRAHPLEGRRARRRRHRGDGEARRRDDRRLRRARPEPRRVPRCNTFGCQIAQVAVDPGTGEVRVERVVAVHDVGRIVNPLAASSQVEGGVLQGVGVRALRGARRRPDDRRPGQRPPRRLQGADDRRRARDRRRLRRRARREPAEPRREGARRAADRPDRSRDRERLRPRHRPPRRGAAADARPACWRRSRERLRAAGERSTRRSSCSRGDGAVPLGGGTDLAGQVDRGIRAPALARRPPATPGSAGSTRTATASRIGATMTLAELAASPLVAPYAAVASRGRRGRLAAPAQRRHGRRQPLPAHALLVLPRRRVALLARRRRHLLRADRRPPQARPRAGRLHLRAPVRPRARARRVRRDGRSSAAARRHARAAAARALPAPDGRRPLARRRSRQGELVTGVRLPAPPDASAYERARRARRVLVPARLGRGRPPRRGDRASSRPGSRTSPSSSTRPTRSPGSGQPAARLEAPRARDARRARRRPQPPSCGVVTASTLARCDEPEGAALGAPPERVVVLRPRGELPEVAGRDEQLADLVGRVAVPVRALVAGVEREADDAERVRRMPHPEHRRRHRQVLVDPEERDRVRRAPWRPAARSGSTGSSAVGDPGAGVVEHRPQLAVVEPGRPRRAHGEQERVRLAAVRVVGRVDDLLGRHEPVEVEQVERAPHRRVEEDPGPPGEVPRHRGEVDDPRVRDDQRRRAVPVERAARASPRSAAARGRRG